MNCFAYGRANRSTASYARRYSSSRPSAASGHRSQVRAGQLGVRIEPVQFILTQRLREVDPDQLLPSRHGVGHSLSTAGREIIPGASVQAGHPAVGVGEGAALDAGQGVARHRDLTGPTIGDGVVLTDAADPADGVMTAAVPQANTSVMSPEAHLCEAPRC